MIYPTEIRPGDLPALSALEDWERVAWGNEKEFLAKWTDGGEDLCWVAWMCDVCKFCFITPGGTTITDTVSVDEWLDFYHQHA